MSCGLLLFLQACRETDIPWGGTLSVVVTKTDNEALARAFIRVFAVSNLAGNGCGVGALYVVADSDFRVILSPEGTCR